jgi:hypothetical protein
VDPRRARRALRRSSRLALPERLVEPDAGENALDLALGVPAAEVLEPRGEVAVAAGERVDLARGRLRHRVRQRLELLLEGAHLGEALLDERAHAEPRGEHRALHDVADARVALELHAAVVRRLLALDEPQERRLAGPVAADAADLLAARDVELDPAQDLGRAVALPEVGDRQDGHRRGAESAA